MNAPLLWFIVGVAFFVAELMTPAMVLLFFGVGAWASALAALLGMDLAWQIVVFICISLLTLLFLRRRLRAVFGGRSSRNPSANCDGQDEEQCAPHLLTGRQGVVSKALHPGQNPSHNRAQTPNPCCQTQRKFPLAVPFSRPGAHRFGV